MIGLAVIGYGYWGPNVVRNLQSIEDARVEVVCDCSDKALRRARQAYPALNICTSIEDAIKSPDVDAVAIVTPVWTHFELAKAALENGKHVFVEKPFTANSEQAQELIDLAASKRLCIMVDHTFLFTGAVRTIRSLIDQGTLGELYYYDSTRINLGLFQHDVNVIWDLAPHDFSIMDYLIGTNACAISATGETHVNGHADVAYVTAHFPGKLIAHLNVNWLSPVKIRTTLIGGQRKMLVWNDLEADEKIKIYDKGVEVTTPENIYDLLVKYRSGDMWSPRVEQTEALNVELRYFLECIQHGRTPINDGEAGLRVVRMLEAAEQSMNQQGRLVEMDGSAFSHRRLGPRLPRNVLRAA